jgi:hypothetical protein
MLSEKCCRLPWRTRILTGGLSPRSSDMFNSYFGTRVLCRNAIFQPSPCFSKNADSNHF